MSDQNRARLRDAFKGKSTKKRDARDENMTVLNLLMVWLDLNALVFLIAISGIRPKQLAVATSRHNA
jgi:hypothetical protein